MTVEELMFSNKQTKIKKVLNKALESPYYSNILKNINIDNLTYEEFIKWNKQ